MLFVPCIVIQLCNVNQQNALKTYHTKAACTNGLPDDERMMFETCRRHQELN